MAMKTNESKHPPRFDQRQENKSDHSWTEVFYAKPGAGMSIVASITTLTAAIKNALPQK